MSRLIERLNIDKEWDKVSNIDHVFMEEQELQITKAMFGVHQLVKKLNEVIVRLNDIYTRLEEIDSRKLTKDNQENSEKV